MRDRSHSVEVLQRRGRHPDRPPRRVGVQLREIRAARLTDQPLAAPGIERRQPLAPMGRAQALYTATLLIDEYRSISAHGIAQSRSQRP